MERTPQLQTTQARPKSKGLWLAGFSIFLFLLLLSSCFTDDSTYKQPSKGRPGEVMVVMSLDHWNGSVGDSVRHLLKAPYPWILQLEPSFQLFYKAIDDFTLIDKAHRNIIYIDVSDDERNIVPKGSQSEDRWAADQKLYTFRAPDAETFFQLWSTLGPSVVHDINITDRGRIQRNFSESFNPGAKQELRNHLDVELTIASDFKLMHKSPGVMTLMRERIQHVTGGGYGRQGAGHDVKQGLIIYSYPYTGDSLLEPEALTRKRNEVAGKVIRSANDAPMITEPRLDPDHAWVKVGEGRGIESRGLWKFEDPIQGGNFISLTLVDEEKKRVVTADGYVFAPNFKQRPLLLEIEAMIYSLEL